MPPGLPPRAALALAAALALVANGCARPERVTLDLEPLRVSVELPAGWRHVDLGRRHVLQEGEDQIAFESFGPAGREGIRRAIERARGQARAGDLPLAQAMLRRIPVGDDLFATPAHRSRFRDVWNGVSRTAATTPAPVVDAAFEALLAAVDSLPERDSLRVEREVLRAMGADDRRDVASRRLVRLDGHDARLLETWHRMTHEPRGRHLIVLEDGEVLGAWTARGAFTATAPVFDRVTRSLRFLPAAPRDSAAAARARAATSPSPA